MSETNAAADTTLGAPSVPEPASAAPPPADEGPVAPVNESPVEMVPQEPLAVDDEIEMVVTLNEQASYGRIRGHAEALYVQGGEYFGPGGKHLPHLSENKGERRTTAPPPAPKHPAPPARLQNRSRAMQGSVDLAAWANGKAQYIWPHVAVAVEGAVGERPRNKIEALSLLRTHGVIDDDHLDDTDG